MARLFIAPALLLIGTSMAQTDDGKCRNSHKAMLQTGVVSYGEVVIDRPVEEVWPAIPQYYQWSAAHAQSRRTTLRGESGKVGELVQIVLQSNPGNPLYAETVRIRPLQKIDGSHRAGSMVWKVYDKNVCFSRFSEMGVREYEGRTIFSWSVYEEFDPVHGKSSIVGRDQVDGKPPSLDKHMATMKRRMEEYLSKLK